MIRVQIRSKTVMNRDSTKEAAVLRTTAMLALLMLAGVVYATTVRPNVLVVITDDQGYGDFSVSTAIPSLKTPELDRLHGESVRLTDFHVAPVCTPTRGQLMTGRDALANGAMSTNAGRALLRREIPTAANIFAASGYRTGQFGKWHLGDNYPYRPHDRGFDKAIYFPGVSHRIGTGRLEQRYLRRYLPRQRRAAAFLGVRDRRLLQRGDAMDGGQVLAGRDVLRVPGAQRASHAPFRPDRYRAPYQQHPANLASFRSLFYSLLGLFPGLPYQQHRANLASFYGMIASIDENMGRLDAFLERTGLRRNTILVFLTDDGATTGRNIFNAGMRDGKASLYDGGHRVPCFVRWPAGGLVPRNVDELTQVQDILPTLLELTGTRAAAGVAFDGVSLAPLLRGTTERLPDRTLVVQYSRVRPAGSDPRRRRCALEEMAPRP